MLSEQEFFKLWHKAHGLRRDQADFSPPSNLWELLEPHLRGEFPREAVNKIVCNSGGYHIVSHHPSIDGAVDDLERLWNGDSNYCDECDGKRFVSFIPRMGAMIGCPKCNPPKPLCGTCGGSQKKRIHEIDCIAGLKKCNPKRPCGRLEPCPDCKPEIRYHRSESGMHLEERGAERRQGKADRRDFANRRCAPDSGRTYATQHGGRRESQRRSTTLVGALRR
ncbi:hypothetical protein LCGC14_0428430 [marine sediment metagenome]|uniref:Uncharacterized protein n=1 Tax=marine sediment metagenome TaxID=412755 RepID=A0A0F9VY90_9ZZZZ